MYAVSKRYGFSASHVLHGLGDDHPCSRLHGHNYDVEVIVEAAELDGRGFVVDFGELDAVKTWIDEVLDHRHLNDVLEGQPSAEAIARCVFEAAERLLPVAPAAIRVWETPRAFAEYRP